MAFADPRANLQQLNLSPGQTVVDFGAGTGAYALAAAGLVGSEGRVYAVEIQKELLAHLKQTAINQNFRNIELVWGDIEQAGGTGLSDHLADAVVASNVLFQAKSMYTLALELKRLLKPGGKALVVEWSESFGGTGPAPADVVASETVKQTFSSAGLSFVSEFSAGDHHYGLIFTK
ncbi:MAG: hypothetical protein COV08_03270 [Candidatus Vogelbacteria bacterium CG10_big_fil_rev_8_21_14_0_10_49_38]|uniref:Methyltransferase domain-containing protein n=1 Tax=Candidatus Vogelbacteria bacterium CG10_big_fil_rev_8_21_14_0_10_49_38 TaxID=1975043 RepID=A0A2H0RJ07_9BACT|nr:MAG: hypothetical protein BK006_03270 [bacterium CG10_49_38]PIR45765.1 MAG: hypothetical protein COV08_03270 [Candidatus Vogelbacteria bacterium CG10_big_fil_rev_8_21_14_0_10_49_38]